MPTEQQGDSTSFHFSVEEFLDTIKNSPSVDTQALPQRSNFGIVDVSRTSRDANAAWYADQKDSFVQNRLRLNRDSVLPGLYFFFDPAKVDSPFFYIGKADNLFSRLTKHFLTFDYFFYAAAFPERIDTYYNECLRFYAEGTYQHKRATYERQFTAFRVGPFKEIGWISIPDLGDESLLKTVESNAIFRYKPRANGTKGTPSGNQQSSLLFGEIVRVISAWMAMGASH